MPLAWSIRVPKSKSQYPSPYGQYDAEDSAEPADAMAATDTIQTNNANDGKPSINQPTSSGHKVTDGTDSRLINHHRSREISTSFLTTITHPVRLFSLGQKDKMSDTQQQSSAHQDSLAHQEEDAGNSLAPPADTVQFAPETRRFSGLFSWASQDTPKVSTQARVSNINMSQPEPVHEGKQSPESPAAQFKRRFSQGLRIAFNNSPASVSKGEHSATNSQPKTAGPADGSFVDSRPALPPPPPPSAVFKTPTNTTYNLEQNQQLPESLGLNARARAKLFFNRTLPGVYGTMRRGKSKSAHGVSDVETGPWVRKADDSIEDSVVDNQAVGS